VKLASALLLALNLACQTASDSAQDPVWGKQACSSCAMLVSEPQFAAQLVSANGDRLYFDDVGCMAAFIAKRKAPVGQAWVRDVAGGWVRVQVAKFSKGVHTPMDYGFVFSAAGTLDWDAVQRAVRERSEKRNEP